MVRTIDWRDPATVVIIDQTKLPGVLAVEELTTVESLVASITRLAVRGAPALGAAGALGVALALAQARREGWDDVELGARMDALRQARPTAANLAWGVDHVARGLAGTIAQRFDTARARALALLEAEAEACVSIGERGADFLEELCAGPLRIHTHCNAGALACVEWGTALGVVRSLHRRGRVDSVLVSETRPLLQGSRLTAWELREAGIAYRIVADAAGPGLISRGAVDAVVVGADRIAANGDVANKVGTYPLALAAARAGIPFVVAAPESTLDPETASGAQIPLEERPADELLVWDGRCRAPRDASACNPAFDVTPADLVTAIVTEVRVVRTARQVAATAATEPATP